MTHAYSDPKAPIAAPIDFSDFMKVDIRIGTIIDAQTYEGARKPAYIVHIDFGEVIGVKKSSAQITQYYTPQELIGRQIAAVVNFPPRQIGSIMSQVLCVGFPDTDENVVLFSPDKAVLNGARLF